MAGDIELSLAKPATAAGAGAGAGELICMPSVFVFARRCRNAD